MSAALLAGGPGNESGRPPNAVPIDLRIEDSLRRIALPIRPLSAVMVGVVAGSLVVHLAILAATVVSSRAPLPVPKEISVEVVQGVPKAEQPKPEALKPAPVKEPEVKKPEAAKPAAPPPPPKTEEAKLEPLKPGLAPATAKTESPKAEAPKPQPKVAQPPPLNSSPAKPSAPQPSPSADSQAVADLQRELAALRAEQAALNQQAKPAAIGSGPMDGSAQGIALPSISGDDTGDVVGYQALVFSQLAKAKDVQLDNYRGEAGTTGVRFEVDDAGKLVKAEIAATSGKPALDAQALDIVHHASPFPAPPKDGEHTFYANVNFIPPKPK